ncbi:hypothetical protein NQ318_013512 [Aromia moschata]|uniref:RNA-directed DNA polymerase n=1 Tax=Aromia moschata TaxID=1265417 RepID=A0AAV8YC81_9CUCU|nr:hypothetical protein NQ318_013512 [Aromia moschata]
MVDVDEDDTVNSDIEEEMFYPNTIKDKEPAESSDTNINQKKNAGDRRIVRRQTGERKSDDRRTNNDDERTVRRQNDDDRRTVRRQKGERKSDGRRTNSDDRRTNGGDRRTVRRQQGERNSDGKRTNGGDRRTNDDDKRTETRRRGVGQKVNRIEKEFQENREEIERRLERRLEDTKRQVQKEILEKIEGLEHQLHRTSIADSGDCSTSPATPLQHSSLMHTERSVHKMLKPPTYDGQSSWSMYRRQFEAAAKANGWTPQEMATSLVISLRGQALEILQSIPEEQQNDYDRIVGALEIRYGHKYLRQVYQSQIKSRQQRSNESLQEYEADIERLIHLAYPQAPKEFLEQIGIQTFIDGLVDTEMQQALRLGRHTTISDALVAALEFKAAKEASRSYKSRVRQVKFDECQSLPETMEKIMRALDEIKQSNSPQKETRRCYNCGKIGHLQRFCRARSRSQSRTNSPDRQPDSRSRSRSPDKRNWREENGTPKTSFQITSKKFGKRQLVDARGRVSTTYTQCPKISVSKISSDERSLLVHGYLDDKWRSFVIDTGATRTILRPDILPKPPKQLSRHVRLETATGELIPVHGEVYVKIQLGSKIMYHQVLIADIRDDCILGLDILSKHGFVVDIKNRIIQIQNEEIVMAPKLKDYNQSRRIIVEEDIQMPQGSENIIIAKLDGNGEGLSTGIVEANERNDGLLIARTLVQMNNQIPVRIANISDRKIILKKNEVLGRCEPIERVIKCEEVNQAQLNPAKELKKSQKKDSDLKLIRNWVKNGVRPTWQEVSRYGTTIKGYWAQWNSLCLRDGLLHRKWESPDGVSAVYQLVLPKARIHQVLEELHNSPTGGHFGVTRTLARVRDRFYWINCRRDVEEWCKRCDLCSAKKGPKTRSRGKMVQYLSGAPFERVAVDILGPLPVTDRGNKYLMVVMDYFSKWPEAVPLPNQEAETVAEAFIENVIARHGVPLELHSDQGRNFESELWQEVMKIMGIKKTRTTALHPQSNGMVERHNRTICHYLSKFVSENQRDWDKLVPLFLLSYRSSQHESTTYTPSMLTSGREMKLPTDLILGHPVEENQERSLPEFVEDLRERMDRIHQFAREKLKIHSDKMKQRLDTTSTKTAFKPGDAVWLYAPKRTKGKSPKLQSNWEGPYTIIKKINDLVYRIQLSPRSKPKVVHLERLAKYTGHDPPDWFVVEDPPPRTEDSVIRDE